MYLPPILHYTRPARYPCLHIQLSPSNRPLVRPQRTCVPTHHQSTTHTLPRPRPPTPRYNGGEGQEPIAFLAGYEDPAALGWRYTGHDSRITAAYDENVSGACVAGGWAVGAGCVAGGDGEGGSIRFKYRRGVTLIWAEAQ